MGLNAAIISEIGGR